MDLPSFIWLWRIAAWSMGLSLSAYGLLLLSGAGLWRQRRETTISDWPWLRSLHILGGLTLVGLILLLLTIGIVGTLGEFGTLGHSLHLLAGGLVATLSLLTAGAGLGIHPDRPWARPLHWSLNGALGLALGWVSWSGWLVVQKYLPG